jgi:DNA-directed RNA polymerase subunit alpha
MRIRWRDVELPNRVSADRATLTDTYGKFTAEPFQRGFGVTVGNSLRRILLSSLEGSAVTRVKIQGVRHEISSMPGAVEDVTDIILNIKSLLLKNASDQPQTIRIDRRTRGVVKAADIIAPDEIQILNPEHVLATIIDDVPFVVEMRVENGCGYRLADENAGEERDIGVIPIDSSFSPVVRVKYEVEDTRVGQRTNYDKLVMEIWTNGAVTPQMALVESAKILRKHLNPFIQYSEPGPGAADDPPAASGDREMELDVETKRKLEMNINTLGLSVRATNCLESMDIATVGDLVVRTDDELLQIRNFGDTALKEVKQKLETLFPNLDAVRLRVGHAAYAGQLSSQWEDADTARGLRPQAAPGPDPVATGAATKSGPVRGGLLLAHLEFDASVSEEIVHAFLERLRQQAKVDGGAMRVLPERAEGR